MKSVDFINMKMKKRPRVPEVQINTPAYVGLTGLFSD